MRKPFARIKFSRNFGSAAPGRALASTWQNQLPVRDCQKRCIAETLVKLSGTSLQKNQAKSKEPPWGSLKHRNYRAGSTWERSRSTPAEREPPQLLDAIWRTPPLTSRALQCSGAANTTPADISRSEVWGTPISRRLKPTATYLTLP